ncbi:MAG: alcohol dehydrogenase catalytic domain-containing protein [Deltaproteobacteria bacterium]|nr:alcohol dehydrogenase catalytic domain-containing protein [Deltaproteobacteria bacterium]
MLALLLDGTPRLVTDHPIPARRPGEALIAVRVAGVCDTDLGLVRGYMGYRGVLGHEFVGTVTACDDDAWVGRRVVGDINAGCGACEECRLRGGHHCARRTVLGIAGRDGALAEALVLPTRGLCEVPDAVSDDAAVFAEPLAAALHVADELAGARARAGGARGVAVLGDGKLGLLIALALTALGEAVTLVGRHEAKLAIARARGARALLEADAAGLDRSPVVVEATGTAAGLGRALALTAPRGTLVLKTTVPEPPTIDTSRIVVDEVRVVGSRCGDMARAVEALARGEVDPTPLIAARYPLTEAALALEHAGRRGVLKVLVDVGGAWRDRPPSLRP